MVAAPVVLVERVGHAIGLEAHRQGLARAVGSMPTSPSRRLRMFLQPASGTTIVAPTRRNPHPRGGERRAPDERNIAGAGTPNGSRRQGPGRDATQNPRRAQLQDERPSGCHPTAGGSANGSDNTPSTRTIPALNSGRADESRSANGLPRVPHRKVNEGSGHFEWSISWTVRQSASSTPTFNSDGVEKTLTSEYPARNQTRASAQRVDTARWVQRP
jgi:hypothetical protein